MMTENEIKSKLNCPKDRTLKSHIDLVVQAIDCQGREQVCSALEKLDGVDGFSKITLERQKIIGQVYTNPEFERCMLDRMDNIRNMVLLNGDNEFIRGRLVEASETLKFFKTHNNAIKNNS